MPDWTRWPFPAEDPYPAYHEARRRAPAQWNEDLGAHLILSHELAGRVLKGQQWSSDPRNSPELFASMGGSGSAGEVWVESLLMSDPPGHTRLRRAVNRFFTPRAVHGIRGRVAAIVDTALEPLRDGEPVELMGEVAYPIPLGVIAELFDVGLEGAQLLREQTPTLARMLELDPGEDELREISAAAMAVMLFLVPVVAQRRTEPGDDLLSALIHPPDGGVALQTEEIITMCLLLLAAAHETTANLIGNGTLALLQAPKQLRWLAEHPGQTGQAVEELLRFDSPAQVASRVAMVDMTLGGVMVHESQQALVVLGAANRDPSCYPDPDRLDLSRPGPAHLAFGNGPHYCVGAGLARLEALEAFSRLAQLPVAQLTGCWSYERDRSRTFRRLRRLQIGGSGST